MQYCYNRGKKILLFSFPTKFILVLLAHGEKSSKIYVLTDGNRFPSFKPLFSQFLSRFLIKLATQITQISNSTCIADK